MRVCVLEHVSFEGPGSIGPALIAAGHSLHKTALYRGEPLPDVGSLDWLIVMGGPMGANDDAQFDWLGPEKGLIRQAIDCGKRVLGICLGAQLIAAALGARVFRNAHREIGWFPIHAASDAAAHPLGRLFPQQLDVFHWHGDTFDLPPGAVRLASSEACREQAFALGKHVLALQFHLEMTPQAAAGLVEHCRDELTAAPYVQAPGEMLAHGDRFAAVNALMERLLAEMAAE